MKKLKFFSLIVLFLSFGLCLFACKDTNPIQLLKPITIGYVVNNNPDTNEEEILLVTDKNPKAYKYEFYISDTPGQDKYYVSYLSDTNYLNVTNIFEVKKDYYFYVKYIGSGRYLDSIPSNIEIYTPEKEPLTAPTLHMINTYLNWQPMQYATGYEIYESVSGKTTIEEHKIATINGGSFIDDSITYDISNLSSLADVNAPYNTYSYKVKAITTDKYHSDSNYSNSVEYIPHITLNRPNNLSVTKQENAFTLSWNEVPYATGYEVIINNSTVLNTSNTDLDVSNHITNYAEYSFTVRANVSDVIKYNEGEASNKYIYTHTAKIDAPTNLQAVRNGEYILITFTETEFEDKALYYTLTILCDGSRVYFNDDIEINSIQIAISSLGNLTTNDLIIKVNANAIGNYIFASDSVKIDFTILN